MLTVKHIRFDGAESLDHADRVLYYPSDQADVRDTPTPHAGGAVSLVKFGHAADGEHGYHDGIVYVMNDRGATVARYDLGFGGRDSASNETKQAGLAASHR